MVEGMQLKPNRSLIPQIPLSKPTIDLTMNVYTDPRLLDVAGALEALPGLTLGSQGKLGALAGA